MTQKPELCASSTLYYSRYTPNDCRTIVTGIRWDEKPILISAVCTLPMTMRCQCWQNVTSVVIEQMNKTAKLIDLHSPAADLDGRKKWHSNLCRGKRTNKSERTPHECRIKSIETKCWVLWATTLGRTECTLWCSTQLTATINDYI